jgi:hypothetical protein
MKRGILFGAVLLLSLANSGCVKGVLVDAQIKGTREGSGAIDELGDYEMARSAVSTGIVQFEGLHGLRPDNEDGYFLLMKGWTGYAYGFAQDDYEEALLTGNEDLIDYQKKRAKMAFDRAVFYSLELLQKRADGFAEAKKNEPALKKWLEEHFTDKEDAEPLFWAGYAWMARVNLMKDESAYIGELYIGTTMMAHSVKLDPTYADYSGSTAMAAYHARTTSAEPEEAKKLFEMALEKTQRKQLLVHVNYARTYACVTGNKDLYEKLLNEVLNADDPDPKFRLQNVMGKRRAKRSLQKVFYEDCSFTSAPQMKPKEG